MGDFNADFKYRFGEELVSFTADNALQISDGILLGTGLVFSTILAKHMTLCRGLIMQCALTLHIGMFYLVMPSMILHLVIIFLYKLYIILNKVNR